MAYELFPVAGFVQNIHSGELHRILPAIVSRSIVCAMSNSDNVVPDASTKAAPLPPPAPSAGVPAPIADPNFIDPAWQVPTSDETAVPKDDDGESWLELLRDGYYRQLREENEYKQPPPFPRVMHFAAPPGPVPEGKFPRQVLEQQRAVLAKFRPDPPPSKGKMTGKGGKGMMMGMDGMGYGMGMGGWNNWGWDGGWGMKGGGWGKGKGGMGKKGWSDGWEGMPY
eukprot:s1695_g6.t4